MSTTRSTIDANETQPPLTSMPASTSIGARSNQGFASPTISAKGAASHSVRHSVRPGTWPSAAITAGNSASGSSAASW